MLKPHQTRNQYLRARLDTCTDVNIMPASIYKLVFNDPELKKLAPSTLEFGTYTTNTVKIAGSFLFYLVHPDTKKLQDMTFYVAQKWLVVSCCPALQHLHLDLYNLTQDWIIYHPELAWLQAQLTTLRRPRECLFTAQEKECPLKGTVPDVHKLVTSKEQILQSYQDVLEVIGCFLGPPIISS